MRTADFYCVHGTHMSDVSMRTGRKIVRTYAVRIVIYLAVLEADLGPDRLSTFICHVLWFNIPINNFSVMPGGATASCVLMSTLGS